MKLHFFYGLSFAILAGMLEACNNDNDASIQQSANEYQDVFEQTIKFAGNTYHVPCTIENDSLIYLDEEFNSLFKSTISQMPERTAFISKDENGNDLPKTIISREYSSEWKPGDEPYYPVNDAKNGLLYSEYKKLAEAEDKVIFGGRLGEYKYYDMDQVIAAVLDKCEKELGE